MEKQELFAKQATENDQIQQRQLPSKMKSSYGKIVYLANNLKSLLYTLEVVKGTMKCLSKILAWTRTIKAHST